MHNIRSERLVYAAVVLVLVATAITRSIARGASQAQMTRTHFEVGIPYSGEPIGTETTPPECGDVDDWSRQIDWGDHSPKELLQSSAKPDAHGYIRRGTYDFFGSKHSYQMAGTYMIALVISHHCVGSGDPNTVATFPFQIVVEGHIPILSLTPNHQTVKRGSMASFTVKLTSIAPLSNTRLMVQAAPPVFVNPAPYVDIMAGASQYNLNLPVRMDATGARSTIKVWTDPTSPHSAEVTLSH